MNNQSVIKTLNIQSAFVGALLVAVSINLFIIQMYKDITINGSSSKYNTKQIYNLAILSSSIFLIVTIYFFISAYEEYENNKSNFNFNYYMANVLSLNAQIIRVTTVLKYPESIIGTQDII